MLTMSNKKDIDESYEYTKDDPVPTSNLITEGRCLCRVVEPGWSILT
jgi:hypothetical protein